MTEQELASLDSLDLLIRLRAQVNAAISYFEHGMPMYEDLNPTVRKDHRRILIELGDFVILARFIGSKP